jgi:rhamnose utilization protein RhaD (predicted bifunctional aldolase and dehydrogenase)/NAD(P)-dependent dehydrogenase (short-subunit alcohol dehydrogenase family)
MTARRRKPRQPKKADMDALVALSRRYGSDPAFLLAGGGNTSCKTEGRLYVKASGEALATINADGFVAMDRDALDELLNRPVSENPQQREAECKEALLRARCRPEGTRRPSVESLLHHVLPETFVVHTHPTAGNAVACCRRGEEITRELFGDEVLWVPFVHPGLVLARALQSALADYAQRTGREETPPILMGNHGLIVTGQTPEQIHEKTDTVLAAVRRRLEDTSRDEPFGQVRLLDREQARRLVNAIGPALRGLVAEGEALKVVTFDDSRTAGRLVGGRGGRAAAAGGPLTPDQIVYCQSQPLWFEPATDEPSEATVERLRAAVGGYKSAQECLPKVVLVQDVGLFAAGDDFASADTARQVYLSAVEVMAGADALGGVAYLSEADSRFIASWEAESYRRAVAATAPRGRAAGKVAFVTGAAQGIGLGIARDLADQGAHVILADVNEQGAAAAAEQINSHLGGGWAMAVAADVTDADSVALAVHQAVRRFGGLDVLVSNAGVLLAESVKTQSARDFDLVTAVNYRGYFVCVQAAAPVLAIQHRARSDYLSDVVQINSKSGLVGSNRNFAYAGSKFGGIGLTQSFALELMADGIKVNSICPGNYFDGPLWSDPETGLFAQYLRAGKVPGARSVEDVRRAYEAKVPMGRGCTIADIMKAIYYVIEQRYETGQAIPVTGGQVMLR